MILVEYDTDEGNRWVPYPVAFASLPRLARAAGFSTPRLLARRPSRFLGSIYAAELPVGPSPAGIPASRT